MHDRSVIVAIQRRTYPMQNITDDDNSPSAPNEADQHVYILTFLYYYVYFKIFLFAIILRKFVEYVNIKTF